MRCIVTGNCGFIGSHLTDALVKDHHVLGIDNLSTGKIENYNRRADFIEADINDDIWDIGHYDYVFHCASLPRIQPSIKDPVPSHEANVNGTLKVLEYCRKTGAKLIFSSSSSIYAGDTLPTRENALKDPKSPYSLQKWLCEQYIELYAKLYGLNYVILRYFNVYGDRQLTEGAYATVIGIFLKQKAEGRPLTITGKGEQRRDFTHVSDVVNANLLAMDWNGTFNIGAGHNYSINEVADMIGGDKNYIEAREGEVEATRADNLKAQTAGWKPKKKLKDYFEDIKHR